MIHRLKTHPDPFRALAAGLKTSEFRKDNRDPRFEVGDTLVLEEWEPELGDREKGPWKSGHYTGWSAVRGVTHVLRGPAFGVPEGFAVLSLSGGGSRG